MTGLAALVVWIGFILSATDIGAADSAVWASLLFIALLVGARQVRGNDHMRTAYEIAAHLFTLGWLAREALLLDWGVGSISFLWALVGTVEYGLALKQNNRWLYRYGLAVLVLVGLKLLLVDMQAVSLLWRAILFMVLGVLYVVLGLLGQRHLDTAAPAVSRWIQIFSPRRPTDAWRKGDFSMIACTGFRGFQQLVGETPVAHQHSNDAPHDHNEPDQNLEPDWHLNDVDEPPHKQDNSGKPQQILSCSRIGFIPDGFIRQCGRRAFGQEECRAQQTQRQEKTKQLKEGCSCP